MNDKIFTSLLSILQKQANAIRGLKELNIVLGDLLRQSEERAGVPYEEFEKRFQESLSTVRESGPAHDWHQGVAKEIEEAIDELNLLENLRAKPLN